MSSLYIVATPIGNMEDITLRALRILKEVGTVFCEDTRVSGKLLQHFEIPKPLVSLRERAQDKAIVRALELLGAGEDIAYITDAGTPGVSDPGGKLVAAVANAGFATVPIPGPSALAAAISIAGIPLDRFLFLGFPPHKKGRQTLLQEAIASPHPVILYESPHRILRLLEELQKFDAAGSIEKVVIGRELTKKFETVYRGPISEVLEDIKKNARGEFVVIVGKNKIRVTAD